MNARLFDSKLNTCVQSGVVMSLFPQWPIWPVHNGTLLKDFSKFYELCSESPSKLLSWTAKTSTHSQKWWSINAPEATTLKRENYHQIWGRIFIFSIAILFLPWLPWRFLQIPHLENCLSANIINVSVLAAGTNHIKKKKKMLFITYSVRDVQWGAVGCLGTRSGSSPVHRVEGTDWI